MTETATRTWNPLICRSTDPVCASCSVSNSCTDTTPGVWDRDSRIHVNVTCAGLKQPLGTGPFKLSRQTSSGGVDTEVVFTRHNDYWGSVPEIEELHLKFYANTDDVERHGRCRVTSTIRVPTHQ